MSSRSDVLTPFGLVLRLGFFGAIEVVGLNVFAFVLFNPLGYLVAAVVGTFLAAVVANAIAVRIWERGNLSAVGMGWNEGSPRRLLAGIAAGSVAALLVVAIPLVAGTARLVAGDSRLTATRLLFVTAMLLFGAVGEELLFRGYGFQLFLARTGPWVATLVFGVLFGLAHSGNLNAGPLGLANTAAWGLLFGYIFWRSGDLWMPIGLHFGWNWTLPMLGANVSGFTMEVTGYKLEWSGHELWHGGAYGPEASALTSVMVVVLGLCVWRLPARLCATPRLPGSME